MLTDVTMWMIAFSIVLAMSIGSWIGIDSIQQQAVKTECAQYNSNTGDFEWIKDNK